MHNDEFEETLAADEADTLAGQRWTGYSRAAHRQSYTPEPAYDFAAEERAMEAEMAKMRAETAKMEREAAEERRRVEAEVAEQQRKAAEQQRRAAEQQRKMNAIVSRMTAAQSGIEKEARTENNETMKMYRTMEKIEQVKGKMQSLDRTISELREHTQRMQQGV